MISMQATHPYGSEEHPMTATDLAFFHLVEHLFDAAFTAGASALLMQNDAEVDA